MKKKLFVIFTALILAVTFMPAVASADLTLKFDDVPGGSINNIALPLPTNYAGFTWSAVSGFWGVYDNVSYRGGYNQNSFDFPSNPNVVINEDGNIGAPIVTLSRSTPFNLVSAYFSPWTKNSDEDFYGASALTLTGYLNNVIVGSPLTFNLTPGALQLEDINFSNIDKITFAATKGADGYYFLMDNAVVTPIPAAVWLLGTGLVGLFGVRRRFTS